MSSLLTALLLGVIALEALLLLGLLWLCCKLWVYSAGFKQWQTVSLSQLRQARLTTRQTAVALAVAQAKGYESFVPSLKTWVKGKGALHPLRLLVQLARLGRWQKRWGFGLKFRLHTP